jgi:hypothetical protein
VQAVKILNALARPFTTRIRISGAAVILLCASALTGNFGQFIDRARADDQIKRLEASQDADTDEAECRSRIVGYVEGLSIELNVTGSLALLARREGSDLPITFDEALERAAAAAVRLEAAKGYRESAVEVCAENPDFDPTYDIKESSL